MQVRVAAGYVIAAWLLIQVVETVFPAFGLDDAAFRILIIALAIGLVPVVILAWAFELTHEGLKLDKDADSSPSSFDGIDDIPGTDELPSFASLLKYPRFSVPILGLVVIVLAAIGLIVPRVINSRWAHLEAIPEIISLVEQDDVNRAYALAEDVERYIPDDPVLADLLSNISVHKSIGSEPGGSEVFYKEYSAPDDEWTPLGWTPNESVRLPRTVLRWRFEKPGLQTAERALGSFNGTFTVRLPEFDLSAGEVHVPTSNLWFLLTGFNPPSIDVPQYIIGQYEVTNREYREFVQSGGYENPDYWQHLDFMLEGQAMSWEQAMDRFRDPTGRLGPSTWRGGTFPKGEENYPVQGVSWFEAAAYAAFSGKDLPSIYHWSSAAIDPASTEIEIYDGNYRGYSLFRSEMISLSNFSDAGAAAVGSHDGVGAFGTYDMAGNVREWCWNATGDSPGSDRYILGGSWSDPSYLFTYGIAESPWDRSESNGFRLVEYIDQAGAVESLKEPVARPVRERIPPVTDEVFQVYRDFYAYDRTDLNVVKESVGEESVHWRQETLSFDATYGDERVIAHLFLPRNVEPPYQVVAYYPSSIALGERSSAGLEIGWIDFIVMSGRAVVYPVIMGTYERNIGLDTSWPKNTRAYSDSVVKWTQDFHRTIDYLETRHDIDIDKLGFYGWSWGGWNGPIVMALDDRFKIGVYVSGGIPPTLARPEASSASFASRVTAPVLMISGRNDVLRPVETYQKPMFNSLGTPAELKRHAILEGGHSPPWNQVMRETLDWLDRHLGPVE